MEPAWEQEYIECVRVRMPALRRLAFLLCGDDHRGDDLVQQTITTLYVTWRRRPAPGLRWNTRTGEVRTTPEFQRGAAAVNARGWMVGEDRQDRPILVTDGRTLVLPNPDPSTNPHSEPKTISDDGRVIAGVSHRDNGGQAVVWRCR